MSWLHISGNTIIVDTDQYINSQPVRYSQVEDVIDQIIDSGKKFKTEIDITYVIIYDINILGLIKIIWELHENTYDEDILESIEFKGGSDTVLAIWSRIIPMLPVFVTELVKFV